MARRNLDPLRREIKANLGRYYIYLLYRPDGTPFYVGAGRAANKWRQRLFDHEFQASGGAAGLKCNIIRKIWSSGAEVGRTLDSWHDDAAGAYVREKLLIAHFGRLDLGTGCLANLTDGGDGTPGQKPSEITRARMSESAKRRERTREDTEHLREWIAANRNQVATTQSRKWKDPEYRQRMSGLLKGVKRSASYVEYNRRRRQEQLADPIFIEKWAVAQRLGLNRPEVKQKLSSKMNLRWQDPEYRERRSQETKALWSDPAFRERMMAARRKAHQSKKTRGPA